MVRAVWRGHILAEALDSDVIVVDKTPYFPPDSVRERFFLPSAKVTVCGWKGKATYFDIRDPENGEVLEAAAWTYAEPKPAAEGFKEYVAFWRDGAVRVNMQSW